MIPAVINYALRTVAGPGNAALPLSPPPSTPLRNEEEEDALPSPRIVDEPIFERTLTTSDAQQALIRRAGAEEQQVATLPPTLGPTLLPRDIAMLVSAAAMAARVSIKASALLIEAVLEAAKYSSITGLGVTRRALIAAVSSARGIHYMRERLGWEGNDHADNAYLNVLDHWTTLGCYVVHHTFSLAELFTMSGFSLTSGLISTGLGAAEESVRALDGIFGSNESSRALASIISMVRREITQDPGFSVHKKGIIATLSALTRALTAFACLQVVTHRRTQQEQRMRVIYDCTVVLQSETIEYEPTRNLLAGQRGSQLHLTDARHTDLHDEANIANIRHALQRDESTRSLRRRSASTIATEAPDSEDEEVAHGLHEMLDEGDDEEVLPDDIRIAIDRIVEGQEHSGDIQLIAKQASPEGGQIELVRSMTTDQLFEIETTTTTTEVKTVVRVGGRGDGRIVAERLRPASGMTRTRQSRDLATTLSHGELSLRGAHGDEERIVEDALEENEWVELSELLQGQIEPDTAIESIPEADNGDSIGAFSVVDSIAHPQEGRQRLQVVLKTMTQRLTHRKRVFRRLQPESSRSSRISVREIEWEDPPNSSRASSPTKRPGPVKRIFSVGKKRSASTPISPAMSREPSTSQLELPERPRPRSATPTRSFTQPSSAPAPSLRAPRRQKSTTSMHSVFTTRTHLETQSTAPQDDQPLPSNFPHLHLVANLRRFMRYSSAAYGQTFMRILGIGSAAFNYPSSKEHHANVHAFAHHTGLSTASILMSSYTEPTTILASHAPPLVHYIAVDHKARAIVLTCRGTLGLSDILVDLTADYEELGLPHGQPGASYYAHSGMLASARVLSRQHSTVHECLKRALEDWKEYGLVLAGHSLGGGVVALLAVLLSSPAAAFSEVIEDRRQRGSSTPSHPPLATHFVTSFSSGLPPGRPIHCYAYGPPSVASIDLCNYSVGLITSVAHNLDIVPTLSLGVVRDMKSCAQSLWDEPQIAEEIVGRVIGLYQAGRKSAPVSPIDVGRATDGQDSGALSLLTSEELSAGRTRNRALDTGYRDPALLVASTIGEESELDLWALMKTIRAGNDAEKLYPPGTVYVVEWHTVFVACEDEEEGFGRAGTRSRTKSVRKEGRRVIMREAEDVTKRFGEIPFSRGIFTDHSPTNYEQALDVLAQAVLPR